MSAELDIDITEFERAVAEAEKDIAEADRAEVTANAKKQVYLAVLRSPMRSGNLRSAFTKPWRALGFKGKPMTKLKEGEKVATYYDPERNKDVTARFYSHGGVNDQRWSVNPSFSYAVYAAEWRTPRRKVSGIIAALQSGILSKSDADKVRQMMSSGTEISVIMQYLNEQLGERAKTFTAGGGYWRPYHRYFAGNRRTVTGGNFKFSYHHKKVLEKYSGK